MVTRWQHIFKNIETILQLEEASSHTTILISLFHFYGFITSKGWNLSTFLNLSP